MEIISKVLLHHQNLKPTQLCLGRVSDSEAIRWMDILHSCLALKIILRMPMSMMGENTIHQEKAMRILVVDDEKDVREMLRDFLEIEGFEVFEAAEGRSAVEIAREQLLDVVLTDLRMPGPDGLRVLKEIRRIRPETAVLIFTGYASLDNALDALELGCDGYVNKPIRLDQLRYIIHQGLIKRKLEREHLGG